MVYIIWCLLCMFRKQGYHQDCLDTQKRWSRSETWLECPCTTLREVNNVMHNLLIKNYDIICSYIVLVNAFLYLPGKRKVNGKEWEFLKTSAAEVSNAMKKFQRALRKFSVTRWTFSSNVMDLMGINRTNCKQTTKDTQVNKTVN